MRIFIQIFDNVHTTISKLSFFLFILFISVSFAGHAQLFERIEEIAGLEVLKRNNGVAVADYDRDNDLDIFVIAHARDDADEPHTINRLFRNNNNGSFTDVTESSGLLDLYKAVEGPLFGGLNGYKYLAIWGDYDNNGYPDLFVANADGVFLYKNKGNGKFEDATETSGLWVEASCETTGATWFDFNRDGFLDIFMSDWGGCSANSLFINDKDGTFTKVNIDPTYDDDGERMQSYTMMPFDFNGDGYLDMLIANDFRKPNNLFINQSAYGLVDEASAYGLDSTLDDMGIAIGDIENDGDFDFFFTGIKENALYINDGKNNFTESLEEYGLTETDWSWGCHFEDYDLDGDVDLLVVNGFIGIAAQTTYFKNNFKEGQLGFENISTESGIGDFAQSVEAVSFDYDNDGDLDVFVSNTDRESYFYENKTISSANTSDNNWVQLRFVGDQSNRDGLGTLVKVETENDTLIRSYNGIGFLSQNLNGVHVGLNTASSISKITLIWPSGIEESYESLDVNEIYRFVEGQGFTALNIQPSVKIVGCTDPNSCNYNPLATENDYSCEYLPAGEITGAAQSGFNTIESYSYQITSGSTAEWTVEGGEILSGQGTNMISVQWKLEEEGLVTVREISTDCIGELAELRVDLDVTYASREVSVARLWNEALLEAIRRDFARPNVHARNLYHTSVAMYNCWAIYDNLARPYFMGNTVNLEAFTPEKNNEESQKEAMSYAAYTLLSHRFANSPGADISLERFDLLMHQLGYNTNITGTNYESGSAAMLGNYIAEYIINYGMTDNARESNDYDNGFYEPVNPPLELGIRNQPTGIVDPNRWQPLQFSTFVDQSGNLIVESTPEFLGPEWGTVKPFAMTAEMSTVFQRDGHSYRVYHDPGEPPQLNTTMSDTGSEQYKWNFSLVAYWSSHLDPADGVMWDISPRTIGNIDIAQFTNDFADLPNYYKEIDGGDTSLGHATNPHTGQPYEVQMVPRADYARVLAEFWADGPDSETPPGHWFTILNHVNDHPDFIKKFNGEGEVLSDLEWDIKSYFVLAGAMHDAAIAAWGVKGWYDYIRPISAIRYMSELGQSSDPGKPSYHVGGIPLKEGFVQLIEADDPLAGYNNENVGKIKIYGWRGHDFISNAETDVAGVGWILAKDWWPYQRPSFVTPPFAGYVSGHSTYSRAAAEVMTLITGDAFFPGGMGEFIAKKDEFLVFEKGPSVDVILQWATYRDASDQTSLSRIWGGIHPPADDIPGRLIGEQVGIDAYNYAVPYFYPIDSEPVLEDVVVYPNPVFDRNISVSNTAANDIFELFDILGKSLNIMKSDYIESTKTTKLIIPPGINAGVYFLKFNDISKLILVEK